MIIKLFEIIGLIVAWTIHSLAISLIVALALLIMLIEPLLNEERVNAIASWGWPDKYEAIISKITGVKV